VGGDFAYAIQVENVGSDPAVGVELAQATPAGTTFQSVSPPPGWSCTTPVVGGTGPITCNGSNLSAASTADFTITVKADICHVDGTTVTNTATASSLGTDATPGDNSTTIDAVGASEDLVPDLAVDLINAGHDVQLEWGDWTPTCGYRVQRSTMPDGGFVDASGSQFDTDYVDSGAGSSPDSYYYLVRVD